MNSQIIHSKTPNSIFQLFYRGVSKRLDNHITSSKNDSIFSVQFDLIQMKSKVFLYRHFCSKIKEKSIYEKFMNALNPYSKANRKILNFISESLQKVYEDLLNKKKVFK